MTRNFISCKNPFLLFLNCSFISAYTLKDSIWLYFFFVLVWIWMYQITGDFGKPQIIFKINRNALLYFFQIFSSQYYLSHWCRVLKQNFVCTFVNIFFFTFLSPSLVLFVDMFCLWAKTVIKYFFKLKD